MDVGRRMTGWGGMLMVALSVFSAVRPAGGGEAPSTFRTGEWTLAAHPGRGHLAAVRYGKTLFFNNGALRADVGEKDAVWTPVRHDFDPDRRQLVLEHGLGSWRVTETVRLDAHDIPGLFSRTFELEYRPDHGDDAEPRAFGGLSVTGHLPRDRDYWLPGSLAGNPGNLFQNDIRREPDAKKWLRETRHHTGALADLPAGTVLRPAFQANAIVLRTPAGASIVMMQDQRRESAFCLIDVSKGLAVFQQGVNARGWAFPGKPQRGIGGFYMRAVPGNDMDGALAETMPAWYRALGVAPPADRPEWVAGASLYELATRAGPPPRLARAADLLPRARELGFNTLHVMPVQEGAHEYQPRDFFRLDRRAGTPEDLRNLVDRAHGSGLRVLLDIVPHGGFLSDVVRRGTPAVWLSYNRAGQPVGGPNGFPHDYKSPAYQRYVGSIADFYMRGFRLDGFRIDQPWGSEPNWRRAGFPTADQQPPAVARDWFRRSLEPFGGAMPPLEYERASLGEREGGLEMCRVIRRAVRERQPDGATFAEVLGVMSTAATDVVYDHFAAVLAPVLRELEPGEFAPALARLLHERQLLYPPGTRFLRVFQNHDHHPPFRQLGAGAGRALFAASLLADGVPMLYQYADTGHGPFIGRLHAVRARRPELTRGSALYRAVRSSAPEVWTVLRRDGGQASVGLVNFAPHAVETRISMEARALGLAADGTFEWHNALADPAAAARPARGGPGALADFAVSLAPFEVQLLTSRPAAEPASAATPIGDGPTATATANAAPRLAETPEHWRIEADGYALTLDRKTGLPTRMDNAAGQPIFGAADWLTEEPLPDEPDGVWSVTRGPDAVTLAFRRGTGPESLSLTWRCGADAARLEASWPGRAGGGFAALLLPAARAAAWRVGAWEGVLEDRYRPPTRFDTLMGARHTRQYRCEDGPDLLWDAERQPPDPFDAFVAFADGDGRGGEVRVDDWLRQGPANMVLFGRVGGRAVPTVAVYIRNTGPLAADAPPRFSLTLSPTDSGRRPPRPTPELPGGLALANDSVSYRVANRHYRVRLDRLGGALRDLADAEGRLLLDRQRLFSQGLAAPEAASNRHDMNTGVRVWREGDAVRFRFLSLICGWSPHRPTHRRTWAVTEYGFDAGAAFASAWHMVGDQPAFGNASTRLEATLPPTLAARPESDGGFSLSRRDENAPAGRFTPLFGARYVAEGGLARLSVHDGAQNGFMPRRYGSAGYRFIAGGADGSAGNGPAVADAAVFQDALPSPDGSFARLGRAWSAAERRSIALPTPAERPGLWVMRRRGEVYFDADAAAGNGLALRLEDRAVVDVPLPAASLAAGKHRVAFAWRGRGLTVDCPVNFTLGGAGSDGERVTVKTGVKARQGDFAWETLAVDFELPKPLAAPYLGIELVREDTTEAPGVLWLDDFRVAVAR